MKKIKLLIFAALLFSANFATAQKLSSEEKEQIELYKPKQFSKVETNWMDSLQQKHWPDFFDANGNGYKVISPKKRNANKKIEAQFYKVNKDFSVSPWLCYESETPYNFPAGFPNFSSNTSKNFVDNEGNLLFLSNDRNGLILYKIDKNGIRSGIAGNSFHGNEIKDGKGSKAWLGRNTQFVSQTADGNIFLIDYQNGNSGNYFLADFDINKPTGFILRVLTPDGEIKTVKDKNGACFLFIPNSHYISISENGYWYYSEGGIINRLKPGLVINEVEKIAGNSPQLSDPYQERKVIKLGTSKTAILFGSVPLCATPTGEVYVFNEYWNRLFRIKNNMVEEFCGKSDLSKLRGSLSATAGQKEGSAKTAEVGWMSKIMYREGNLYSIHYGKNVTRAMKIDMKGNATFIK